MKYVLVVEDEYLIAVETVRVVEGVGAEVVGPVRLPAEALRIIAEGDQLDAAILDLNLDGERSDAIADALAADGVPFAFLSGYSRAELPEQHPHAPYVRKPADPAKLARVLRELLDMAV